MWDVGEDVGGVVLQQKLLVAVEAAALYCYSNM